MTRPMTYARHFRKTLALGLPLVGGHLAQFLIGLTDTVMLGWYGVDALAAITLAASVFHLFFLFGSGFAWAVMPMVAAFAAAGDETGLRRATRMGVWLSVLFAALVLPVMFWMEPILLALGQTPGVAQDAASYVHIACWGLFPALILSVLKSYLAALERTQVVLWVMITGAFVNALGNYALIFGHWGAPELGLQGAAIASITTNVVMVLIVIVYVQRALPQHTLFVRLWRADWEMFGQVLRLGVPIGLTTLAEVSLFSFSAVMMGWLGTVALAAHGIALQLISGIFMLHLGLSNAATVRAGNALGRRDGPGLARAGLAVIVLSLLAALVTIVPLVLVPEPLMGLFLKSDDPARADILVAGAALLMVAALFQLVDGAQVIALGLLRGVQDTTVPMIIATLAYVGIGLPASYILGFVTGLGGVGIWLGLVVGLSVAAVLLMGRFWLHAIARVSSLRVPD